MDRAEFEAGIEVMLDAAERLRGVPYDRLPTEPDPRDLYLGGPASVTCFTLTLDCPFDIPGWCLTLGLVDRETDALVPLAELSEEYQAGLVGLARLVMDRCCARSGQAVYSLGVQQGVVVARAEAAVPVPGCFT